MATYAVELLLAWSDGDISRVVLDGLPTPTVEAWFKYGQEQPLLTLVSSNLAHGAWHHILCNALLIAVFAPAMERWVGSILQVPLFIGIGIATSVAQASVTSATMWGASGAAFSYLAFWPLSTCRGLAFSRLEKSLPLWYTRSLRTAAIGIVILMTFPVVGGVIAGVGYLAHIAGFLVGVVLAGLQRSPIGEMFPGHE